MALPNPDPSEVSRRYASTYSAPQETPAGTKPPVTKRELKNPEHAFVLVNLAHQNRRPQSDKPAIRILGFFPDTESAEEFSKDIEAHDPACALAVLSTCSWYVLTKSQDVNPTDVKSKLDALLDKHKQLRVARKIEFEQHRAELRGDRKPLYQHEALNPCEEGVQASEAVSLAAVTNAGGGASESKEGGGARSGGFKKVKPVPATLEQRNMKSAVLSVMDDYTDATNEIAFAVYDGFENDEGAQTYVEHVAKRIVQDHDIAVVAMYEWLYPELREHDAVKQVERNAELNRIMSARRARDSEVNTFKSMCAELKVDVPFKDVLPDLGEDKLPVNPDAVLEEGKSTIPIKATDTTPSPEELQAQEQKEKEEKEAKRKKRELVAKEISNRPAF